MYRSDRVGGFRKLTDDEIAKAADKENRKQTNSLPSLNHSSVKKV
jgi:hypothetical protein